MSGNLGLDEDFLSAYVYIYIYVCMCAYMYIFYVPVDKCIYVCIQVFMYVFMYVGGHKDLDNTIWSSARQKSMRM
jgi:hypothetical protein